MGLPQQYKCAWFQNVLKRLGSPGTCPVLAPQLHTVDSYW